MVTLSQAQLNDNAEYLKSNDDSIYTRIKERSVDKWEENHKMIVYEINKLSDSVFDLAKIQGNSNYDKELMIDALGKWVDKINGKENYNYTMVVYEYKKQIKAKNSY